MCANTTVHSVLVVGVFHSLFFLMDQVTHIAATPNFDERGAARVRVVSDDNNWTYVEASLTSGKPNTLLERCLCGWRFGFKSDALIEIAAINKADKFIDDDGKITYGNVRIIGNHTYYRTAKENYTQNLQKELQEEAFRQRMANIDEETHEKELVAVPA